MRNYEELYLTLLAKIIDAIDLLEDALEIEQKESNTRSEVMLIIQRSSL